MFLYYKTNNANIIIEIHPEAKNLLDYILIWGMKGRQQSYQEYYTNENNQKLFLLLRILLVKLELY
jgi:hypothetical protein